MKNIIKLISILSCLFMTSSLIANAQIEFKLSLELDESSNSYKVLAFPNFSMDEFLWGPSQVSLVFPSKVENSKFVIASKNAGQWSDNSNVFSPKVQADCDFHGFGTNGSKVLNIIKDQPILLFELKLENGNSANPRLFDSKKDPKSYDEGMLGSDFNHSIIGHNGEELYAGNLEKVTEASLIGELSPSFTTFPNPTNGKFTLNATGIELNEVETISIFSISGVKIFESEFPIVKNQANVELPEIVGDQKVFLRLIDKNNQPHTTKIIIQK